mmetsp:Transcript_40344/g.88197  ORF Transcript_40344/g.88197 Transcript_40344/m.88197 type:complete len:202 (-) Transcript_40344:1765-2370(-)
MCGRAQPSGSSRRRRRSAARKRRRRKTKFLFLNGRCPTLANVKDMQAIVELPQLRPRPARRRCRRSWARLRPPWAAERAAQVVPQASRLGTVVVSVQRRPLPVATHPVATGNTASRTGLTSQWSMLRTTLLGRPALPSPSPRRRQHRLRITEREDGHGQIRQSSQRSRLTLAPVAVQTTVQPQVPLLHRLPGRLRDRPTRP